MKRLLLDLVVLITSMAAPVAGVAQDGTPAMTSPEDCLSMETFPVPDGEHPHDVAPAADGNGVWYTAQGAGALGLLDPVTGEVERIPLGEGSAPHGVIVGPDDAAWVTDGGLNAIVRVDAASHEVTTFPLPPEGAGANLNTAVFAPSGLLWFTGQSGLVGSVDPASGEVRVAPAPRGRGPYGIAVDAAGEVWFVSLAGSYLGLIDASGAELAITEFDPPTEGAGTRRVWADSQGVLWVSEWEAGQVGRFDAATETWTEWPLPGDGAQAYAVYVDERDDIWLSDFGANALVRFDPDTEEFVSLPLPDPDGSVRQIHGRPGEVWGAESSAHALVVVRTACDS